MKLPKGFGLQGNQGGMMRQAQEAMARAQTLEQELALDRIEVDKGPVKATFDGTGLLLKLSIDKAVVDPDDVEALEDLILSAVRDGFETATERRNEKVQEIMPNIPGL
jgi:DNA-binding YbaB/EbfC family protein